MAERLMLHYFPGDSRLHRWDARGKLLAMFLASSLILQGHWAVLLGFSIGLPIGIRWAGIPGQRLFWELRPWLLFVLIIVLVYSVEASGVAGRSVWWPSLSLSGAHQGLWFSWRLLLLLTCAMLFNCVTKPRELRDAIIWLLRPLPLRLRYRLAFMAGLTMRFVPLVLDELEKIRDAHKARWGDRCRNPLRRVKYLVLPLFRRIVLRSDDLALALAARSYREDLPVEWQPLAAHHLLPLVPLVVVWILCLAWPG